MLQPGERYKFEFIIQDGDKAVREETWGTVTERDGHLVALSTGQLISTASPRFAGAWHAKSAKIQERKTDIER